jgi:hypothetical protein
MMLYPPHNNSEIEAPFPYKPVARVKTRELDHKSQSFQTSKVCLHNTPDYYHVSQNFLEMPSIKTAMQSED